MSAKDSGEISSRSECGNVPEHGYRVTADGTVFSFGTNWRGYGERALAQHMNSRGYLGVRLTVNGKRMTHPVHRLVAIAFLPKRPSAKHQIRHLDGNPLNNNASNLAWGTAKENAEDRELHGRTARGFKHSEVIKRGIYEKRI